MKTSKLHRVSFSCVVLFILLCAAFPASAQTILVDGGFETGAFSPNWSNSGGSIRAGLNGSTFAAFLPGGGTEVAQTKSTSSIGTPSSFTLDMYFAAGLPPSAGKNSLETSILYQGDSTKGMLQMGVTDLTGSGTVGDVWVTNGITKTVLFTDSIAYSTDVGTGSEVIKTYRIRFTLNSIAGTYDVGLSAQGGSTFTQTTFGQTIWVTNPSVTGFTNPTSLEVKLIGGNTGGPPANQGVGIFDNIYLGSALIVPEPSSIALLGIASVFFLKRSRRKFLN